MTRLLLVLLLALPAAGQTLTIDPDRDALAFGERVDLRARGVSWWRAWRVRWSSDLEGDLGRGGRLRTGKLRPGLHRIAAEVTAGGRTLRAEAAVHVDGWGQRSPFRALLPVARKALVARLGGRPDTADRDALRWALRRVPHVLLGDPLQAPPGAQDLLLANPSPMHAALGHGDLTVGVDRAGTLTLMRWPGPSGLDQLDVQATDYGAPHRGLREDHGLFCGVRTRDAQGVWRTSWLRDADWGAQQAYAGTDVDTLVTRYVNPALGLEVVQTDAVDPGASVLARRLEVRALPGSALNEVELVVYGAPAPCTTRVPYLPYSDTTLDLLNGFVTLYDPQAGLVLSGRPRQPDPRALLDAAQAGLAPASLDALVRGYDADVGAGAVLAFAADPAPDAFHVGYAGAPAGSAARTRDPYDAARAGPLPGGRFAAGRSGFALARRVDLRQGPQAWTLYAGAGDSADGPQGARAEVLAARARGFQPLRQASEAGTRAWLGRAVLPRVPQGSRAEAVLQRGLLALRTASDPQSGAIVASVAGQMPYAFDWPRDGAYMNRALDLAGFPDLVERHNAFYARVQRQRGLLAGTFDMNLAADGTPGGPWFLEIDNAGCAGWTLHDHARFLPDPAQRRAYLRSVLPALARTAEFFVRWRDPRSGLPLPAMEDDTIEFTQGIQGSISGLMALDGAIEAGAFVGHDPAALARWRARRQELHDAIQRRFRQPGWVGPPVIDRLSGGRLQSVGARGMSWAIWPARILDRDPLRQSHADALFATQRDFLRQVPGTYLYNAEVFLAVARARRGDLAGRQEVERGLRILLEDVPTPGTLHFGEQYVAVPAGAGVRWENRNDVPHVWEHVLVYLAARELYGPQVP